MCAAKKEMSIEHKQKQNDILNVKPTLFPP